MVHLIKSLIRISRPGNILISIFAVLTGYYLGHGSFRVYGTVTVAIMTAVFLLAGANTINDVFDFDVDRKNRPGRPLPSGSLSKRVALIYAIFCFLIAIGVNLTQDLLSFGIIIVATIILILYTPVLKPIPLLGNGAAAVVSGAAFLYGASMAGHIKCGYFPFLIAFLLHLSREMVKDLEDQDGDRKAGLKTLAVIKSAGLSHIIIFSLLLVLYLIIGWTYWLKIFNDLFIVINSAVFIPVIIYTAILFFSNKLKPEHHYSRLSFILKLSMIIGVVSFILGNNI